VKARSPLGHGFDRFDKVREKFKSIILTNKQTEKGVAGRRGIYVMATTFGRLKKRRRTERARRKFKWIGRPAQGGGVGVGNSVAGFHK